MMQILSTEGAMLGERIRQARLASGLKPKEVIESLATSGMALTKQALSNYEKGKRVPKARTMMLLAKALGVTPADLMREPEARVEWVAFRCQSSLGVRKREEVQAKAEKAVERYEYLRARLYPGECSILPIRKTRTLDDAESAAEHLRRHWRLGEDPIDSLTQVVESHGGIVVAIPFQGVKFDGLSGWVNGTCPLAVVNASLPDDRRRFDLAHELGHLTMDCSDMSEQEREKAAHRFAGALLVPASAVKRELGDRRRRILSEELAALKRRYGLSMQAWLHRARDLHVIDDRCFVSLCRLFSARGWRKREPVEYQGHERSMRFRQMTLRALAEGIVTEGRARELDPGVPAQEESSASINRDSPSPQELLRLPREERLQVLTGAAAEPQELYGIDPEVSDWAELGLDDLHE
jgi:Zn-dependent peptidase ImmA (M78 family)